MERLKNYNRLENIQSVQFSFLLLEFRHSISNIDLIAMHSVYGSFYVRKQLLPFNFSSFFYSSFDTLIEKNGKGFYSMFLFSL